MELKFFWSRRIMKNNLFEFTWDTFFLICDGSLKPVIMAYLIFGYCRSDPSLFKKENISFIGDMQEDVLERAKKAKEKAAREAMEAQGLIPKPTTVDTTPATDSVDSVTSSSTVSEISAANPSSVSSPATPMDQLDRDPADKQEPALGVSNDD